MGMVVIHSLSQPETSHLPRFGINFRALVHPDLWPVEQSSRKGALGFLGRVSVDEKERVLVKPAWLLL